jgi:sulfide dehydrogenase [flavocytochrome c] flavoprotein chain
MPLRSHSAKVVVVGGGFAGAAVAKYLRILDADIQVTLIEPKSQYITCPASNWLFADLLSLNDLTQNYQALTADYGVTVIQAAVESIEPQQRKLRLNNKQSLDYDRLVLATGIDFHWDNLAGYSEASTLLFPHAWQAGKQTLLLQQQMQAMADGGLVVISVPKEPYRCPPGPYERASMMAYWLKQRKPKSKVLILDAKTAFSKQKLFEAGWARHFGFGTANSLIEWQSIADNPLLRLDEKNATLHTDFGDKIKAQVLNIIPPQQAGLLARQTGLTDSSGWCPVNAESGLSALIENIYVIGDSAHYAPIPKSAFAANSEAKACALAIVCQLNEQPLPEPQWLNTCYSLITPQHGISVAGVYHLNAQRQIAMVQDAGGVSNSNDNEAPLLEAGYAQSVYRTLVADSFG